MKERVNELTQYFILHISNLEEINYDSVVDDSKDTVRLDESGNYFLVEIDTEEIPEDIRNRINTGDEVSGYGGFTHEQMLQIINGELESPTGTGWEYSYYEEPIE